MPAPNPSYEEVRNEQTQKRFQRKQYRETPGADKHEVWRMLIEELAGLSRLEMNYVEIDSQLEFELQLSRGEIDLAYISPLQFVAANQRKTYTALAKARAKPHRAILVTRRNSGIISLRDIMDQAIVYASPLNFAASIVPRESLRSLGFEIAPYFVNNERQAYAKVLSGEFPAAAGTPHGFDGLSPSDQEQLKIIWDTPGYTPDAFVAHSSVPFFSKTKLQRALVGLFKGEIGKRLLPLVDIDNGFEVAKDKDWQDIKSIDVDSLNNVQIYRRETTGAALNSTQP